MVLYLPQDKEHCYGRYRHLPHLVTLAIFGQWQGFGSERGFYRYAQHHLRAAFPQLPTREQYNRQVRQHHDALVTFRSASQAPRSAVHASSSRRHRGRPPGNGCAPAIPARSSRPTPAHPIILHTLCRIVHCRAPQVPRTGKCGGAAGEPRRVFLFPLHTLSATIEAGQQ
jgi:hypothetical protein